MGSYQWSYMSTSLDYKYSYLAYNPTYSYP